MKSKHYNFYFTYNPFTIKNVIQILKNGNIRKCKYLPEHDMCDNQILNEITGNVYFDNMLHDVNNYNQYAK